MSGEVACTVGCAIYPGVSHAAARMVEASCELRRGWGAPSNRSNATARRNSSQATGVHVLADASRGHAQLHKVDQSRGDPSRCSRAPLSLPLLTRLALSTTMADALAVTELTSSITTLLGSLTSLVAQLSTSAAAATNSERAVQVAQWFQLPLQDSFVRSAERLNSFLTMLDYKDRREFELIASWGGPEALKAMLRVLQRSVDEIALGGDIRELNKLQLRLVRLECAVGRKLAEDEAAEER